MSYFNKFLLDKEEIKLIIKPQTNNLKVYFIYGMIILSFFLLYPMFTMGRHGLFLWLCILVYLVVILIQAYLSKLNYYLLTNKRIVYVKAVNKDKFIQKGAIYLQNIDNIKKNGPRNICLMLDDRKFYMQNIKDRNEVYIKLENML